MRKSLYVRKADEAEFEAVYKDVEELARIEALASGDTDAGVAGIILDLLKRWLEEKKAREEEYQPYTVRSLWKISDYPGFYEEDEDIEFVGRPVEFLGRRLVHEIVPEDLNDCEWVTFSDVYQTRGGTIVVAQERHLSEALLKPLGSAVPNLSDPTWVFHPWVYRVAWFNRLDDIPTERDVVGTLELDEESREWLVCPNEYAVIPAGRPELRTLEDVREHGAIVTDTGEILWEYKAADKAADIVVVRQEIVDAARVQLDKVEPIRLD